MPAFAIAFAYVPFHRDVAALKIPLFVVAALSLLPFGLIEQRYYLPFYAFFWLFRQNVSDRLERLQLAMNVLLSVGVVYAISALGKFL